VLSHAVDVVFLEMFAATRRFGVRCVLSRVTLALETLSRRRFKLRTGLSVATQAVRTSKPDRETLLPHLSGRCHKFTYIHYVTLEGLRLLGLKSPSTHVVMCTREHLSIATRTLLTFADSTGRLFVAVLWLSWYWVLTGQATFLR